MRKLLAVVLVAMVGSGFAGCGDDDDDGAAPAADQQDQEEASATTAGEPKSEYCRLALKLREARCRATATGERGALSFISTR